MSRRYIKASELRSFAYCRRAWFLERDGLASLLSMERARGAMDHFQHGRAVSGAAAAARLSRLLLALSLAGLVALFVWWVFR